MQPDVLLLESFLKKLDGLENIFSDQLTQIFRNSTRGQHNNFHSPSNPTNAETPLQSVSTQREDMHAP